MSADVAVLIVSFRTRELLARCLESLPGAAGPRSLQVIVVDNASGDGTVDMLHGRFGAVEVIALPNNRGFAGAMNAGLPRVNAPFVVWLNPDAEMEPRSLDRLVAYLEASPRVGAVGPAVVFPDGRLQPSAQAFPGVSRLVYHFLGLRALASVPWLASIGRRILPGGLARSYLESLDPAAEPREVDWVSGACIAVRRRASDEIGALDEGYFLYCEDLDWCHRLRAAGWAIHQLPSARVLHHAGASAPENPLTRYHYYSSLLRYYRRYRPQAYAWLRPLLSLAFALRGVGGDVSRLTRRGVRHPWWRLARVCWSPQLAEGVPR